jgi:hypothetical protein
MWRCGETRHRRLQVAIAKLSPFSSGKITEDENKTGTNRTLWTLQPRTYSQGFNDR